MGQGILLQGQLRKVSLKRGHGTEMGRQGEDDPGHYQRKDHSRKKCKSRQKTWRLKCTKRKSGEGWQAQTLDTPIFQPIFQFGSKQTQEEALSQIRQSERRNSPLWGVERVSLFVPLRPSADWMGLEGGQSSSLSLPIEMLISSKKSLTETSRIIPQGSVMLTHKINH